MPRGTPIAGMHGDMGWILPKFFRMINKLRFWTRIVKMHPDRLTRNIFKWDWLPINNSWSLEICNLFKLLNIENIFYDQNVCDELIYLDKINCLIQE